MNRVELADAPSPWLASGELVGRYRVVAPLAQSRSSRAYMVEHVVTAATAVLKVGDSSLRIEHEAQALALLDSPSIPGVLERGRLTAKRGGLSWLVVEHIPGLSLREELLQRRRLDPARALRLAGQITEALIECQDKGVVHGDVKPSNIVVVEGVDGEVERAVLIDFGAATFRDPKIGSAVPSTMVTPGYAPPEVHSGEIPTPSADIYSLGSVLYELLSGRRPANHAGAGHFEPLHEIVPTSRALAELVHRALSPRASERPKSARELLRELHQLELGPIVECSSVSGEGHTVRQEGLDTVELAAGEPRSSHEAIQTRPYRGDPALLFSSQAPTVWVLQGDPATDRPEVVNAVCELAEHYSVELLDTEAQARCLVELVSGAPPPWVVVFGDMHVMVQEQILAETARHGETSRLLVSSHENWDLLHSSTNSCALHRHLAFPASQSQIIDSVEAMVNRARRVRRRYDSLRLALRDVQEDLAHLREQHAG